MENQSDDKVNSIQNEEEEQEQLDFDDKNELSSHQQTDNDKIEEN